MKAVILAAGASSRLRPLTDHVPKALVPVLGVPMLRRSMDHLIALGIRSFVMVTGYLEEELHRAVSGWYPDLDVAWSTNPEYASKSNGSSLLCARAAIDGHDFVLLDGDLVYERAVMAEVLRSPKVDSVALRPSPDLGEEEMKIILDAAGNVARIHKDLPPGESAGESIGIARISAATSRPLLEIMHERVNVRGMGGDHYEGSFQELVDSGRGVLGVIDLGKLYCAEIDTPEDLARVERELAALG